MQLTFGDLTIKSYTWKEIIKPGQHPFIMITGPMRGKTLTLKDFVNSNDHCYLVVDDLDDEREKTTKTLLYKARHSGSVLLTGNHGSNLMVGGNYIFCSSGDSIFNNRCLMDSDTTKLVRNIILPRMT